MRPVTDYPIMAAFFCVFPKSKIGIVFDLAFEVELDPRMEKRRYIRFLLDYLEQSELCYDIESIFHDTDNVAYTYAQTGTNNFVDK